jgi:uncharacterized membrane protein (TIGR02234 family)
VTDEHVAPEATPAAGRPRSYTVALGSLAAAAALLFLASGRTWVTVVVADPGLPSITVTIGGGELTYGAPLALLALAGIAGLVALRRAGRVVAGVLLVLLALPAAVSVLVFGLTYGSSGGAADWIAGIAGEKAGVAVSTADVTVAPWWVVELLGVALVVLAGVLAVVASRAWPTMGRRYERAAAPGAPAQPRRTADSTWDQLDAGLDPTLDVPPGDGPGDANRAS